MCRKFFFPRVSRSHDRQGRKLFPSPEKGLTLVELLVAIGIAGIVGMISIPAFNTSMLDLSSSAAELAANTRLARGRANGSGIHVRITFHATSYDIERLQDDNDDDVWEPDGAFAKTTVTLPERVSLTEGAGATVEFNSRGLLEFPPNTEMTVTELTLTDSKDGQIKQIQIWPSGQVLEV